MVAAVAVLQQQPSSVEDKGFHRNFLFRGQLFQFPAQLGRDVHLNVHALNGIAAAHPVRTGYLRRTGSRQVQPSPEPGAAGRSARAGGTGQGTQRTIRGAAPSL